MSSSVKKPPGRGSKEALTTKRTAVTTKTTARRRHGLQGDSCALLWASWEHDDVDAANAEFVEKCLAPPFAYRVAAFEMFESRAAEQSLSVRCGCCNTYGTVRRRLCVTRGRAVLTF